MAAGVALKKVTLKELASKLCLSFLWAAKAQHEVLKVFLQYALLKKKKQKQEWQKDSFSMGKKAVPESQLQVFK